jgi:hypothetical protein
MAVWRLLLIAVSQRTLHETGVRIRNYIMSGVQFHGINSCSRLCGMSAMRANLPNGLDDERYQWVDLDGEGISCILTEQAEGWFYKGNLSPLNFVEDAQGIERSTELVARRPNAHSQGEALFMDLAGDRQPDLVVLDGPTPGFYEHEVGALESVPRFCGAAQSEHARSQPEICRSRR